MQTSKDTRIIALSLRLLTDLITSAPQLPSLRSLAGKLVRAVLVSVENSAGGSVSSVAIANSSKSDLALVSNIVGPESHLLLPWDEFFIIFCAGVTKGDYCADQIARAIQN